MRLALLVALLAAAAPATSVAGAAHPILIAKVGLHDSFTISLDTASGRPVRSIPAGTYSIVVHDYSKIHDFALGSQTENKRLFTTGVAWVGTRTYTVKLTPGNYAYACSAHPTIMNGSFVVTSR